MDNSLLYVAVLPVVLLLWYIYNKDVEKEPRGVLARIFLFGVLSAIPVVAIELLLDVFFVTENIPSLWMTMVAVFLSVACIEEIFKWLVTYLLTYRKKMFNHVYDGIVYCVFASLGFACIENILYVVQSDISTGIMRAILAVPGHCVDGIIMGVFFGLSKDALVKNNTSKSLFFLIMSVLIPTLNHTFYDGLIYYYTYSELDMYIYIFIFYVLISYIVSGFIIKYASKIKTNFDGSEMVIKDKKTNTSNTPNPTREYCEKCNSPIYNGKCVSCGYIKGE